MYKLPGQEELLYYMLYAGAALLSMIASIYLLLPVDGSPLCFHDFEPRGVSAGRFSHLRR